MKTTLIGLISLLIIMPLTAQAALPKPDFNPYKTGESLIDMNRVSMSHSMGFAAGTSFGGEGYYLSRYTNHLKYAFSPKLDMELDLNFVNYGSTSSTLKLNDDNASRIIPEFKLNYRPTESLKIKVEFRQGNPFYHDDRPWYERW